MRKIITLGVVFLAALCVYAQDRGKHIDLLGKGMKGEREASISIPDYEQVNYIIAEAVYCSDSQPGIVKFSTEFEEMQVSPEAIPGNPAIGTEMNALVFRAFLTKGAPSVKLDILENGADFLSFSLYVHRLDGGVESIQAGELVYLHQNEKIPQLADIVVPLASEPRDVQIRFGITELIDDDRVAVFTFESKGEVIDTQIKTWFKDGLADPYLVQEVWFRDVPGEVDKINMTMFSTREQGDSFIAGVVVADLKEIEYDYFGRTEGLAISDISY